MSNATPAELKPELLPCPECDGAIKLSWSKCALCGDTKKIKDRRAPTPSVTRLMEAAKEAMPFCESTGWSGGRKVAAQLRAAAWAECKKNRAAAWAEFHKNRDPALAECKKKVKEIDDE